jgi:hypothetical protein
MSTPLYKLRFFFDYYCGGCLWSHNDAAFAKFGFGILDAATYDLKGNIIGEAKINLPPSIRKEIIALDKLYVESLNQKNPGGASLWNELQWENFYHRARAIHKKISLALGDAFEVVYAQEG